MIINTLAIHTRFLTIVARLGCHQTGAWLA
jgi:hypothetical protein